jgi:hypothetical protein
MLPELILMEKDPLIAALIGIEAALSVQMGI